MSFTPDEKITAKEWNKIIKTNVETALGQRLDGDFIAVNHPGGFPYAVKQQYYNADSLSTLNSLVVIADEIPSLSGSYSTLYRNVIDNLEYAFSSEDQALMNQEETKHSSLVGTIINEYKSSELDKNPEDYPTIMYILQRIKEVTGSDYLHVNFRDYPSLSGLCKELSEYSRLGVYTNKMQNAWDKAYDRMQAISNNIISPSATNGGIKTDGNTYSIGWDKLPETQQILADLQNGSTIAFSFSSTEISESSSNLHFESGVTAHVPFSWLFNITVNHEHEYDLSKFARHNSELSVAVTFKGITTLSAAPTLLTEDNVKGWFAYDILNEAAFKSGKDATGYKLHGSRYNPLTLFGSNGQLRRLKTFVISQQPEIKMSFSHFDCSEMEQIFTQSTDVEFSLFGGLVHGTHNNDYTFTDYHFNQDQQTLTVSIVPAPIGESGSIAKQTAYILGGVAESYGN